MSGDDLKPCPFCGSADVAFNTATFSASHVREQGWRQATFYGVSCDRCGVSNRGIVGYRTTAAAAVAWNRRTKKVIPKGTWKVYAQEGAP